MSEFNGRSETRASALSRLTKAAAQLESELPLCAPWDQAEILRGRLQEFFVSQREALDAALGNFSNTLAHDVNTDLCHVADYAADELLSIAEAYRSAPREAGE